jgi:hypothetical protein
MAITSRLLPIISSFCDSRLRPHSKAAVTTGAAIVVLAATLLTFDVPESLAQGGFFDALFGGPRHQYIVEPLRYFHGSGYSYGYGYERRSRHYVRRHNAHLYAHRFRHERHAHLHSYHLAAQRPVAVAELRRPSANIEAASFDTAQNSSAALGRRTVCVRTCDGYFFPVANLKHNSDISSHQATCDTLCPQAETKLFVMPAGSENMDEAVAAGGGELYSQLLAKINTSGDKAKSCGCHSVAGDPVESKAVFNDHTLRVGDSVVTSQGVRVFKGGAFPYNSSDFMSLAETRNLPAEKRGALAAIDRVLKTPHGRAALLSERLHEKQSQRRHLRSDLGENLRFN